MANPVTTEQFVVEVEPGQLITIAPGRGPFNRYPFVATVERVVAANPAVVYAKTPKAGKEVRLSAVLPGARCDRFRITGSAGEWQISLGYDKEFLGEAM